MAQSRVIGVTQRVRYVDSYDEYRDELDHQVMAWVVSAGHIPVAIPNALIAKGNQTLEVWLTRMGIEGLLFSGGNDIGEFEQRDSTERFVLQWAREANIPVLGLCRGMQFMAVEAGATLKPVKNHVATRHSIEQVGDDFETIESVNSYHNHAIASCPADYHITARSTDGEIEAIKHESMPWEAWMWHPEREENFHPEYLSRFNALLNNRNE